MRKVLFSWSLVMLGACLWTALGTGCSSGKGKNGDGEYVEMEPVGSDIPLGHRFEDGEPVTDVQFSNVQFGYDSFQIAPTEIMKVEAVADYMRSEGDVLLVVEGHCDERGSREYNMALGEHRALAVRAHIVRLGIDGQRIQTRSYGEEQPLDAGHNESAWRRNRRAEFKLFR